MDWFTDVRDWRACLVAWSLFPIVVAFFFLQLTMLFVERGSLPEASGNCFFCMLINEIRAEMGMVRAGAFGGGMARR